ncbi:MAG: cell division protein FtsA [Patescibacteria group bacterium]
MSREAHYVGIDVGTTEVRCVIGRASSEGSHLAEVVSIGVAKNTGVKKGILANKSDVESAIKEAVDEASRLSGLKVRSATVNVNGAHIKSVRSKGVVAVSGPKGVVSDNDRDRAEDAAVKRLKVPANMDVFQLYPRSYKVGDQAGVKDPVGVKGERLEVDALMVAGSVNYLSRVETVFEGTNIEINDKLLSSLAAAEAVLDKQVREQGCVVVDMGASTTNVLVMEDGEIVSMQVIPIGGQNITHDLAIGLKVSASDAEFIKKEYVDLSRPIKLGVRRDNFGGGDVEFSFEDVYTIVDARVAELGAIINDIIETSGLSGRLVGGAVLTGGGSRLLGMDAAIGKALDIKARVGSLVDMTGQVMSINRPQYTVATGLMITDMLGGGSSSRLIFSRISSGAKMLGRFTNRGR